MGRKRKATKEKKRKKVNVVMIERLNASKITEPYKVMEFIRDRHHGDLSTADARIAMAWDDGPVKEDVDGFVKFGRVKRASDLDRSFAPFDFILVIRRELWQTFDATRKEAEIDRMLCRCAVSRDNNGEILLDEKDRSVFRLRKPVEVFSENVARYGFFQEPKLADMLARYNDSQRPLLDSQDDKSAKGKKKRGRKFSEAAIPPGATSTTTPGGIQHNGQEEAADTSRVNGHADAWRDQHVSVLEAPYHIDEALRTANLNTLGDVADYEAEHGSLGMDELKGMGTERGEMLRALVARYREAHPELAQSEA